MHLRGSAAAPSHIVSREVASPALCLEAIQEPGVVAGWSEQTQAVLDISQGCAGRQQADGLSGRS